MNFRRSMCLMSAALVWAAGSGVHTQSNAPYTIIELGTLGGTVSDARDINAAGQVVGYAWIAGNVTYHAVLWQSGTTTDLTPLQRGSSAAVSINESGQIVGGSVLWQNSTTTNLNTPVGGPIVGAAINVWGEVAGWASATAEETGVHAVRYHYGGLTDLGTFGGNLSQAFGINDSGQIVGYAEVAPTVAGNADDSSSSGDAHAFLWKDGVMKDLGTLGGNESFASAVNASGDVVGMARTADNRSHPFRWHNDVMTDLGVPPGMHAWALDINVSGQVVGFASVWDGGESDQGRAILWQNGVITDLNTLLLPNSGWVLEVASAINDCGQIVGTGYFKNEMRGFLLTPPDGSNRCLTPANPSPDGTEVPPASQVIDGTGAAWTLGGGGETLQNGIHMAGGYARSLLWTGGTVYARASDDTWFRWNGTQWIVAGMTKPGNGTSPEGTQVPPSIQVIDGTGAAWTLGGSGETLRNGIHMAGGYARSLLWSAGTVYARASDDVWFQWSGTQWSVAGMTKPGNGTVASPEGTQVPPSTQVIDGTGAAWTLGGSGETLRNGIHMAGGYARSLLWSAGTVYARATDDVWWEWSGTEWAMSNQVPN